MQYVRSLSGSVSKTWNSINPATLSGAIDVIVVELEDGIIFNTQTLLYVKADRIPRDFGMFTISCSIWEVFTS